MQHCSGLRNKCSSTAFGRYIVIQTLRVRARVMLAARSRLKSVFFTRPLIPSQLRRAPSIDAPALAAAQEKSSTSEPGTAHPGTDAATAACAKAGVGPDADCLAAAAAREGALAGGGQGCWDPPPAVRATGGRDGGLVLLAAPLESPA